MTIIVLLGEKDCERARGRLGVLVCVWTCVPRTIKNTWCVAVDIA